MDNYVIKLMEFLRSERIDFDKKISNDETTVLFSVTKNDIQFDNMVTFNKKNDCIVSTIKLNYKFDVLLDALMFSNLLSSTYYNMCGQVIETEDNKYEFSIVYMVDDFYVAYDDVINLVTDEIDFIIDCTMDVIKDYAISDEIKPFFKQVVPICKLLYKDDSDNTNDSGADNVVIKIISDEE